MTHLRHSCLFIFRCGFKTGALNSGSRNALLNKRSQITIQRRRMAWRMAKTKVEICRREIRRRKTSNPVHPSPQSQQRQIPVHLRIIQTGTLSQLTVISLVFFFLNRNFVYPIKSVQISCVVSCVTLTNNMFV